jgi:hypothetical protein
MGTPNIGGGVSWETQFYTRRGALFLLTVSKKKYILSVADPDPGSGAFLTPGSGIGKKI